MNINVQYMYANVNALSISHMPYLSCCGEECCITSGVVPVLLHHNMHNCVCFVVQFAVFYLDGD